MWQISSLKTLIIPFNNGLFRLSVLFHSVNCDPPSSSTPETPLLNTTLSENQPNSSSFLVPDNDFSLTQNTRNLLMRVWKMKNRITVPSAPSTEPKNAMLLDSYLLKTSSFSPARSLTLGDQGGILPRISARKSNESLSNVLWFSRILITTTPPSDSLSNVQWFSRVPTTATPPGAFLLETTKTTVNRFTRQSTSTTPFHEVQTGRPNFSTLEMI